MRGRQADGRASALRRLVTQSPVQEDGGNVLKGLAIAGGVSIVFWAALGLVIWALV